MILYKTKKSFSTWRKNVSGTIGLVPTMGAFHPGHLSLIKKSIDICKTTVVTIFVNPIQFNEEIDFIKYPRNFQKDLDLLADYKIGAVFIPDDTEMFTPDHSCFVGEELLSTCTEGEIRPGHFRGVTTIVAKLFNIVQPTHSFFGQKDPQQLRIIKKMCLDLNYDIEIVEAHHRLKKHGLLNSDQIYA